MCCSSDKKKKEKKKNGKKKTPSPFPNNTHTHMNATAQQQTALPTHGPSQIVVPVGVELDDEMSADELLVHPQLLRQRHAGAGPVEGQHAGALDEDRRGNVRPHLEGPGFVHGGPQGLDGGSHYARQRLSTGRQESDIHKFCLKTGSLDLLST